MPSLLIPQRLIAAVNVPQDTIGLVQAAVLEAAIPIEFQSKAKSAVGRLSNERTSSRLLQARR